MLALTATANEDNDTSDRQRLLTDCRTAFGEELALPTAELLHRLRSMEEAPWREYGIRSDTMRFSNTGQAKGYRRADFTDSWARYCPDPPATQGGETAPGAAIPLRLTPARGVAVPAVSASFPQLSPGTAYQSGTA